MESSDNNSCAPGNKNCQAATLGKAHNQLLHFAKCKPKEKKTDGQNTRDDSNKRGMVVTTLVATTTMKLGQGQQHVTIVESMAT